MRSLFGLLGLGLAWVACRGDANPPRQESERPASVPSAPLVLGDPAPELSLLSQTGYSVSLATLLDKPVAVYVCPTGLDADCTSLCHALRDQWLRLTPLLSMAVVIVPSGWNENRAFSTEHGLPLLLLSDRDGAASTAYRTTEVPSSTPRGFLVDQDRVIRGIYDPPRAADHVGGLIRDLLRL
jgi:peroxiredoxin Q/BCP